MGLIGSISNKNGIAWGRFWWIWEESYTYHICFAGFSHRRKGTWIRKESMKKFEFTKKEDENLIRAPFLYSGSWVVMNSPSLSHDRQVLMDFLFLSSFESWVTGSHILSSYVHLLFLLSSLLIGLEFTNE